MTHLATLITDLALLLIVAGITTLLCKRLKQPTVIGYILAGFLIGPVVDFVPTVGDMANIDLWAEIGVIFLMFALGLEFSLHKLASVGSTSFITAFVEVPGMLLTGFIAGKLLGWDTMNSIFLGGMLSMSSTMITIKAVEDLGMKERRFTRLAVGTLVVEDIVAIFLMVVLSTVAVSQGVSGGELAGTIAQLVFYLVLWLLLGIYLLPSFLKKVESLLSDETLLVVSLGVCFGMVWLADAIGFSAALGAFLAGSILAGTSMQERIEHLVTPCKDLFGAVFFVSVGLKVNPAMLAEYLVPIVVLTLATIIGKVIFLMAGMLLAGEDLRTSLHGAFCLTQIGEFSFIIATLGISLGVTADFLYPVIVAVSVITTFTTPYLIKSADRAAEALQRVLPAKWCAAIERYDAEKHSAGVARDQDWQAFAKGYVSTFALYGVILIGIIQVGISFVWPMLELRLGSGAARIITCVLIYLAMAPFLPPMMVFRRKYFTMLWLKSFANRLPLLLLMALRAAVTVLLVIWPLRAIYQLPLYAVALAAVPATIWLARSDWLMGQYLQIQARFLSNFNERQLKARQEALAGGEHHWLDEKLQVAEFICAEEGGLAGKSLQELGWGRSFQANVIKIIRGKKHINIPEGTERVQAGDHLFVLGTAQSLSSIRLLAERRQGLAEADRAESTLRQFIVHQEQFPEEQQLLCYALQVEKDWPFVGASIKDSGIKQEWSCLLIGLERELLPIIHPDPNLRLNAGDLLWVLGEQRMGEKLLKEELIHN